MEDSKLNTIQFAQSLFGLEPDTPIAHEFDVEFGQTKDRDRTFGFEVDLG